MKKVFTSLLIGVTGLLFFTACNPNLAVSGGENGQSGESQRVVVTVENLNAYLAGLDNNTADIPYQITVSSVNDENLSSVVHAIDSNCDKYICLSFTDSNEVTKIPTGLFYRRSSVISITIPNSVATIERSGFLHMNLVTVTIPVSVSSIEQYAFNECHCLKTINYCGTEEQWNAIAKDEDWNSGCPSDMVISFNYTGN